MGTCVCRASGRHGRTREGISAAWLRAFVAACVFSAAASAQALQPDATANAENGKRLFMTYFCYACHGTEGQGGAGPRLVAAAAPDALIRYVRRPTGGGMPPYTSKSIADQQLRDIHAYLRSVPRSPSAKSIPILNW
jgi:mono/diheme cytochrome c family protein